MWVFFSVLHLELALKDFYLFSLLSCHLKSSVCCVEQLSLTAKWALVSVRAHTHCGQIKCWQNKCLNRSVPFSFPQTFDKILIANRGEIACRVSECMCSSPGRFFSVCLWQNITFVFRPFSFFIRVKFYMWCLHEVTWTSSAVFLLWNINIYIFVQSNVLILFFSIHRWLKLVRRWASRQLQFTVMLTLVRWESNI